jgi:gamma-polyglutamate biosynthesis protein CapA
METMVRLNAVGDVMLGDFPLTLGFGVRSAIEAGRLRDPFECIASVLRDGDACFGNLEAVLSDDRLDSRDLRSAQMRGRAHYAEFLARAGFTAMSVAGNHIMQHGATAFRETVQALEERRIAPAGVVNPQGGCHPVLLRVGDCSLGVLAYSLRPEKYSPGEALYARSPVATILRDVQHLRTEHDIVVVSLHWGDEFVSVPSPEQIKVAHSIIDSGACLILGHHPHVLQGFERYRNGLIAYSLGNFVFDMWQQPLRQSAVLHTVLSPRGVESYRVTPVLIDDHYRPVPIAEMAAARAHARTRTLAEAIAAVDVEDVTARTQYEQGVRKALLRNQVQNRWFFIRSLLRYDRRIAVQSVANFVGARRR